MPLPGNVPKHPTRGFSSSWGAQASLYDRRSRCFGFITAELTRKLRRSSISPAAEIREPRGFFESVATAVIQLPIQWRSAETRPISPFCAPRSQVPRDLLARSGHGFRRTERAFTTLIAWTYVITTGANLSVLKGLLMYLPCTVRCFEKL